jgi:hypothetical protein
MQIELHCPCCTCHFVAPPDTAAQEVLERMFLDGPAYALGDGATFEDMIFSSLTEHGQIACPDCGEAVNVSEESLGRMAMTLIESL